MIEITKASDLDWKLFEEIMKATIPNHTPAFKKEIEDLLNSGKYYIFLEGKSVLSGYYEIENTTGDKIFQSHHWVSLDGNGVKLLKEVEKRFKKVNICSASEKTDEFFTSRGYKIKVVIWSLAQ